MRSPRAICLLSLGREMTAVLCWVCQGDTQTARELLPMQQRVNGQIIASLHPSLQVHLKVAMASHSFGGALRAFLAAGLISQEGGGAAGRFITVPPRQRLDCNLESGLLRRPHVLLRRSTHAQWGMTPSSQGWSFLAGCRAFVGPKPSRSGAVCPRQG